MKYELTSLQGCYFNDRITIKISPCDLERYCQIIKAKAEQSCKYNDQAIYHEIYDKMWKNFTDYQEARKEKNEKEGD